MSLERMQTAVEALVETLGFKGAKAGPTTIAEADARSYLTKNYRELRMAVAQGGSGVDVTELAKAAAEHLGVGHESLDAAFAAEVLALDEDVDDKPDEADVFHEDHGFITSAEADSHAQAAELARAQAVVDRGKAEAASRLAKAKRELAQAQSAVDATTK